MIDILNKICFVICNMLLLALQNLHNTVTELYGVPVWGSYLLFAVITLAVGLVLGLVSLLKRK